ncbi:hypothetical protein V1523DRAFT_436813 [Lipomyces doorenjongii]
MFELNDGNVIPALGLGTWQSPDNEVYDAVSGGDAGKTGKVKSIGVANFSPFGAACFCYNNYRRAGCQSSRDASVQPPGVVGEEEVVVKAVAERLSKSPAQVLLSWAIWRGTAVIPKSVTPSRIASKFEDFVMSNSDGELINEISNTTRKRIVSPNWGVKIF